MFDELTKIANILDTIGTEDALQVSSGIDAAIEEVVVKMAEANAVKPEQVVHMIGSIESRVNDLLGKLTALRLLSKGLDGEKGIAIEGYAEFAARMLNKVLPPMEIKNAFIDQHFEEQPKEDLDFDPNGTTKEDTEEDSTLFDKNDPDNVVWSSMLVENLTKVADIFDTDGLHSAASLMDKIIVEAYPNPPAIDRVPREELYDVGDTEMTLQKVMKEVDENRRQHHLATMREDAPAQTRYSPDLPGVMLLRVRDGVYQDTLTKKIYDFQNGWKGDDGEQHAGGSMKNQTPMISQITPQTRMFESRVSLNKKRS